MTQFLFVADIPAPGTSSEDPKAVGRWFDFEQAASAIALPQGAKKLPCRNVWLFPAEGSEQVRRAMANNADAFLLPHSTYLVSGDVTKL